MDARRVKGLEVARPGSGLGPSCDLPVDQWRDTRRPGEPPPRRPGAGDLGPRPGTGDRTRVGHRQLVPDRRGGTLLRPSPAGTCKPPLGRTLLVAKVDEQIEYAGLTRPLFVNRWSDGVVDPSGYLDLEAFHLDGTTPVWAYACADAFLEKRIFHGAGGHHGLRPVPAPAGGGAGDARDQGTGQLPRLTTRPRKVAQNSEARAPDDEPLARLGHMRGSLSTVRQRPCMPG
jgi:Glycogen debranching enzyme N terminal